MDRIRKMFYLILVILNFNCHRAEYSYAVSLYVNNQIALANVVEQMVKKKNFTRISIRKKTFFEKLFTIDFIDKAFVDIIKTNQNYDIISIEYLISSNNFEGIAEEFFNKTDYKYTVEDIKEVNSILYFMYSNNVDNITLKTPELTYLTLMIGFETGIEYRNTGSLDFNVINSKQIEGDWYFVEY
jgi:hypothetical protein